METFHLDSEVPATVAANDGVALATGLYFTVAVDGTVTHARWRASTLVTGTVKWALYRLSDSALLGEQDVTSYTQGAWNTVALTTPIPITAATRYAAVYWSPNYYVATGGYFATSITRGNITAEASGGRFHEPAADILLPADSFGNGCYFVDLGFTAGSVQTVNPASLSVPISLGAPSVSQIAGTINVASLNVPITLGAPTVSGVPYGALQQGSWWELNSIIDATRTQIQWWNKRQPVACPNDGEPLRRSVDGILYCPFDNWRPDGQTPVAVRRANAKDWGGLVGIKRSAAADSVANQLLLACPNDGEPLSIDRDGNQYCKFDGWMPDPMDD